jgi:hypothetical protein
LLSNGVKAVPTILLPLRRLQQVFDQSGQISAVLIANRGDALAGAPLTDMVTTALQSVLSNTAAATRIKLMFILPPGQEALQALIQDPLLPADTRAKLSGVRAELAVPGTSDRLKGLLNDPAVIAALRTITDPAVTDGLDPALSALSPYVVQPIKREGLARAERVGSVLAARAQDWGRLALIAGIVLSVLLIALLPLGRRADGVGRRGAYLVSRNYTFDVGATLLGVALGIAVGLGVVLAMASRVNADSLVLLSQSTVQSAGAGSLDELVIARLSTPAHITASERTPASTTTDTPTASPTATVTRTPTARPTSTNTPTATSRPTGTSAMTGTPTLSSTPAAPRPATPMPTATPTGVPATSPTPMRMGRVAINAGGGTVGSFMADTDSSGGQTSYARDFVVTGGVPNAAPPAVYRTERYGNFTYTVPNLVPGIDYIVRLHFAEIYWKAAGKRLFNVSINNAQVLRNFDIYAAAGGSDRAIVKEFTAIPMQTRPLDKRTDGTGNGGVIRITFTGVVDFAETTGIEVIPAAAHETATLATAPPAPATPSG